MAEDSPPSKLPPVLSQYQHFKTEYVLPQKKTFPSVTRSPVRQLTFVTQKYNNPIVEMSASVLKTQSLAKSGQFVERSNLQNWTEDAAVDFASLAKHIVHPQTIPTDNGILHDLELIFNQLRAKNEFDPLFDDYVDQFQQLQALSDVSGQNSDSIALSNLELVDYAFDNILAFLREQNADEQFVDTLKHIQRIYDSLVHTKTTTYVAYKEAAALLDAENQRLLERIKDYEHRQTVQEQQLLASRKKIAEMQRTDRDLRQQLENALFDVQTLVADSSSHQQQMRQLDRQLASEVKHNQEIMQRAKRSIADAKKFKDLLATLQQQHRQSRDECRALQSQKDRLQEQTLHQALIIEQLEERLNALQDSHENGADAHSQHEQTRGTRAASAAASQNGYSLFDVEQFDLNCQFGKAMATLLQVSQLDQTYLNKNKVSIEGINCIISFLQAGASAQSVSQFIQGVKQHLQRQAVTKRDYGVQTKEISVKAPQSTILQQRIVQNSQQAMLSNPVVQDMELHFVQFLDDVNQCRLDLQLSGDQLDELAQQQERLMHNYTLQLKSTALQSFYQSAQTSHTVTPRSNQAQLPPTSKPQVKIANSQVNSPQQRQKQQKVLHSGGNSSCSNSARSISADAQFENTANSSADFSMQAQTLTQERESVKDSEPQRPNTIVSKDINVGLEKQTVPKQKQRTQRNQVQQKQSKPDKTSIANNQASSALTQTVLIPLCDRHVQTGDIVITHYLVQLAQDIPQLLPLFKALEREGVHLEQDSDTATEQLIFEGGAIQQALQQKNSGKYTGKTIADIQVRTQADRPADLATVQDEEQAVFVDKTSGCDDAQEKSANMHDAQTQVQILAHAESRETADKCIETEAFGVRSGFCSAQSLAAVSDISSAVAQQAVFDTHQRGIVSAADSLAVSRSNLLEQSRGTTDSGVKTLNLQYVSQSQLNQQQNELEGSQQLDSLENISNRSQQNAETRKTQDQTQSISKRSNYEHSDRIDVPGTCDFEPSSEMQTYVEAFQRQDSQHGFDQQKESKTRQRDTENLNKQRNSTSQTAKSQHSSVSNRTGKSVYSDNRALASVQVCDDDAFVENQAAPAGTIVICHDNAATQTTITVFRDLAVQYMLESYDVDTQVEIGAGMKSIAIQHGFERETAYELKNKLRDNDFAVQQMTQAMQEIKSGRAVNQQLQERLHRIEEAQKTQDLSHLLGINVKELTSQKESLQQTRSDQLNKIHFSVDKRLEQNGYQNKDIFMQRKQLLSIFKCYNASCASQSSKELLKQRLQQIDQIRSQSYVKTVDLAKTSEIKLRLLPMRANALASTEYAIQRHPRRFAQFSIHDFFLVKTAKIIQTQKFGLQYKEDTGETYIRFLPCLLPVGFSEAQYRFFDSKALPEFVTTTLARFEHETLQGNEQRIETPTLLPSGQQKVIAIRLSALGKFESLPEFLQLLSFRVGITLTRFFIDDEEYLRLPTQIQPKSKNWLQQTLNLILHSWNSESRAELYPQSGTAFVTDHEEDAYHFVASAGITQKEILYFPYYVVHFALKRYKLKTLVTQFLLQFLVTFVLHATQCQDFYVFYRFLFFDQFDYEVGDIFMIMLRIRMTLGIEIQLTEQSISLEFVAHLIEALYQNWPSERKIALLDVFCKIADQRGTVELPHHQVIPVLLQAYSSYRTSVYNLVKKQLPLSLASFQELLAAGNVVVNREQAISLFVGKKQDIYRPSPAKLFQIADLDRLFVESEIGRFLCITRELELVALDMALTEKIMSCRVSQQRIEEATERIFNRIAACTANEVLKRDFDVVQDATNRVHAALSVLDYEDIRKAQFDILYQLFTEIDLFIDPQIWETAIQGCIELAVTVSQ